MKILTRIRTLAPAALVALAVASFSAGPTHALPKSTDDTCYLPGSATGSSNDYEFYSQGERVQVGGTWYTCYGYNYWIRL